MTAPAWILGLFILSGCAAPSGHRPWVPTSDRPEATSAASPVHKSDTRYALPAGRSASLEIADARPAALTADEVMTRQNLALALTPPDGLDAPLKLLHAPMPDFPVAVQRQEIEGVVRVKMIVEEDGRVDKAWVTSSPDTRLSTICIDTVRRWRFEPLRVGGRPIRGTVQQDFRFGF